MSAFTEPARYLPPRRVRYYPRMRRSLLILLALTLVILLAPDAAARSRRKKSANRTGVAGKFDYYVLTLSWSPEYCAGPNGARDPIQCGTERRFGFVVHGLWPQYEHGYPQNCGKADPVPSNIVNAMLPLMPSPRLIEHEWQTHGTCSGLDVNAYFQTIQKAFASVQIPDDFKSPLQQVEIPPADIKAKFAAANPSLPEQALRIQCGGRYLSETRICMTRDLKERDCPSDIRDTCRDATVIMRPVR
jgi:ribonuclease T2